jgi:UDP-glucose 4-epimerase
MALLPRRVLVTGATGFIGRRLAARLIAAGATVLASARDPAGLPAGARPIIADLAAPGWEAELPPDIDAVAHLAQSRAHRQGLEGAADLFAVNVAATFRLLHWAKGAGVRRFLFASSATVYRPQSGRLTEASPCAPSGFYAASKLAAEQLVQGHAAALETVICRLFTVFGPGQKDMLIPAIIDKVRRGEAITLAGAAGLYLTPIHVDDVAEAMLRLLAAERPPALVNLAGEQLLTLADIAQRVGAAMGRTPSLTVTDAPPVHLAGDSAAARALLPGFRSFDAALPALLA